MADTDVESNDALSCDDSVNSSDDTLEPTGSGRIHYRPATFRDLPAADVKVAFLSDTQNIGIELDLHPVSHPSINQTGCQDNSPVSCAPKENGVSSLSKVAFSLLPLIFIQISHEIKAPCINLKS